jgi:hypothetical protein
VALALLVASLPRMYDDLSSRRTQTRERIVKQDALEQLLRADVPCMPFVVPNERLVGFIAYWRDLHRSEIVDRAEVVARTGTYVFGTEAALDDFVVAPRDGDRALPAPPPSAAAFRSSRGFALHDGCRGAR